MPLPRPGLDAPAPPAPPRPAAARRGGGGAAEENVRDLERPGALRALAPAFD